MGAGPAWMRRGTRDHVAAPRGPAQHLRGARYIVYIYLFILKDIWGFLQFKEFFLDISFKLFFLILFSIFNLFLINKEWR